jgi:hypothetical protein
MFCLCQGRRSKCSSTNKTILPLLRSLHRECDDGFTEKEKEGQREERKQLLIKKGGVIAQGLNFFTVMILNYILNNYP